VTVVKKEVAPAANVDVDVLVKAGYRAAQIEQDLISQVRVCCYQKPNKTSYNVGLEVEQDLVSQVIALYSLLSRHAAPDDVIFANS
jgi:hypothetical protein